MAASCSRPPRRASASARGLDRKSTRLNSSHTVISYAVFCLKKKKDTSLLLLHEVLPTRLLAATTTDVKWTMLCGHQCSKITRDYSVLAASRVPLARTLGYTY